MKRSKVDDPDRNNRHDVDKSGCPVDSGHPWNRSCADLQTEVQQFLHREQDALHRAFNDGNQGALAEALQLFDQHQQPLPGWCVSALHEYLRREREGEKTGKKGKSNWIARYADDLRDLESYEAVLEYRERGVLWKDVYDEVAELFNGTHGGADAIEKAYKRVNSRMKKNPGRYHVIRKSTLG